MRALKVVEQAQEPEITTGSSWNGRLQMASLAPNGVKKLRELILELAVRGKLVPQNPRDEPASELLKRIKARKDNATKTGRKQTEHTYSDVSCVEGQPVGWVQANLGEVTEIIRGITFPSSEKSKAPEKGRIACLRTSNVQDGVVWDDMLYIRQEFISRDDQYLCKNDIVMSMANSRELVGKVALVSQELDQKYTFGGFLGVIRPYFINPSFLMIILRTPQVRASLIDSASQTTNIANISLAKLRPLVISVAPLAEQQRIVAKVDELMVLCDRLEAQKEDAATAHEMLVKALLGTLTQSQTAEEFQQNWRRIAKNFNILFTTESSIDTLKQTILQLAVMGKLVSQNPKDEPASELLKRIKAEKEKLVKAGKIRKDKEQSKILDADVLYDLPKGWEWESLLNCSKLVTDGEHLTPERTPDITQVPLVTAKNVRDGYLDLGNTDFVPQKIAEKCWGRCKPEKNDILVVSVGATTGRLSICKTETDMVIVRSVTLIKPLFINVEYLALALKSPFLQKMIWKGVKQNAQPCLYLSVSQALSIPIPPLAEQSRIVAKVDELMALCDSLKEHLTKYNALHEHLATALVERAIAA